MLAEAYRKSNRIAESGSYYLKALEGDSTLWSAYYSFAHSLKANGKYEDAERFLEKHVSSIKDEHYHQLIQNEIDEYNRLKQLAREKNFYEVKNLDDINTNKAEYSAFYLPQGEIYFTSNQKNSKIYSATGTPFTDIYKIKATGARVDKSTLRALPSIVNDHNVNEGNVAFYPNGISMVFAKGNSGRSSGQDQVNLYYTRYRNGQWLKPSFLEVNDPKHWDSTPFVSRDGKTLYFSSDRPGGFGGLDLYSAKLDPRGRWVDVRNLGDHINTPENEMFPTVGVDGQFYFASDGHAGFGRLDIFTIRRDSGNTIVQNLGKPINSEGDDFAFFEFDEVRGFLSSNRKGGKGDDDIYTYYNKDPDLRIINYFLEGTTVTMNEEGAEKILPNVKVLMFGNDSEIINEEFSNSDGKFRFKVFENENYDLLAEKKNYFSTRAPFTTIGKSVDRSKLDKRVTNITFQIKVALDQIVLNKPIVLQNIYYDLDKAEIRIDAARELDKLVALLNDNPSIDIELGSHTDARASHNYNMDLSERRAKAAINYLIEKGIDQNRLKARGYGETRLLIQDAGTEQEHQINRRTEFKVIKYKPAEEKKETLTEAEEELRREQLRFWETDPKFTEPEDDYDKFFDESDSF